MLETCAFRAAKDKARVESIQGVFSDIIQKSINDSIYFRIKAIKALNNLLQDPAGSATHPTVLLVSALVSNEVCFPPSKHNSREGHLRLRVIRPSVQILKFSRRIKRDLRFLCR
jgi:hypothetical protein